jgi:hypothetical protein
MTEEKYPEEQELSEFHKDFVIRWMDFELKRQQLVSDAFLKERSIQPKSTKKAVVAS